MTDLRARLAVSPSQFRDFDRCERAWWLASVARAPEDAGAGGQYLTAGDLFDEACQRHQARMSVDVDELITAVRSNPRKRREGALDDDKWRELAARAVRQLRAAQHLLPAPKTARIQHRYRVPVPGYELRGGVGITGAVDFRAPGWLWDTKTTADRGPGRGRDDATSPRALDAAGLARDVQARTYAWCEFMLDPDRHFVRATWVYVSKTSTMAWAVEMTFGRAETLAWAEEYLPPRLDRMLALATADGVAEGLIDINLDQRAARANHDGCGRCFRRGSCDSFSGMQQHGVNMAFDIRKMREEQAARRAAGVKPGPLVAAMETALEDQLRASLVAEAADVAGGTQNDRRADSHERDTVAYGSVGLVPINRPDAPPNPHGVFVLATATSSIVPGMALLVSGDAPEGPADFPGQPIIETTGHTVDPKDAPASPTLQPAPLVCSELSPVSTPAAKRGRGRPRRAGGVGATGVQAAVHEAVSPVIDGTAVDPRLATLAERLERIATAFQTIADASDAAVAVVNAELRALGVRV